MKGDGYLLLDTDQYIKQAERKKLEKLRAEVRHLSVGCASLGILKLL
jgi:hypothetical protein